MTKKYFPQHSQTLLLSISSLKLDPLNPRITPGHGIYEWMAQHEKILPLAKNITKFSLNGMNNLGALLDEKDGRYIVLEGNRRLCALHFLLNPSLCSKTKLREAFSKLSQETNAPKELETIKIPVALYPSRKIANIFIAQLHRGANGGIGRIPWGAIAQARFDAMENPYALAYMVMEYAVAQDIKLPQDKDKNITTLQRYLGNTEVQDILGLFINKETKSLESTRPTKEIDQIIERLILDLSKKILSSRSNKDKQIQYANELIAKFKLKEAEEKSKKESFFHLPETLTKEEEKEFLEDTKLITTKRKKNSNPANNPEQENLFLNNIPHDKNPSPNSKQEHKKSMRMHKLKFDLQIYNVLTQLESEKLSVIYKSLCDINLKKETSPILCISFWAFLECLARTCDAKNDFYSYFSGKLSSFGFENRDTINDIKTSLNWCQGHGNGTKHSPKFCTFDYHQLNNNYITLIPLIKAAAEAAVKKQSENPNSSSTD